MHAVSCLAGENSAEPYRGGVAALWCALLAVIALLGPVAPSEAAKLAQSSAARDLGNCRSKSGAEAIAACTRVIDSRKLHGAALAGAYFWRSIARGKVDQLDDALADSDEAVRLDPSNANYHARGAEIWRLKKDYARATVAYGEAIKRGGTYHQSRGHAFYMLRDFDAAIRDFDEALRYDPGAYAYQMRGRSYARRQEPQRALRDFDEALKLNATDVEVLQERGAVYLMIGDEDRARRDYAEATRLRPNDAAVLNTQAWAYFKNGRARDGMPLIERALILVPGDARYIDTRAHIREATGDLPGALADFRRAAALVPTQKESQDGIERVATKLAAASTAAPQPAAATPAAAPSTPERRVALVIGNAAYRNAAVLPSPRRDAETLAATLRAIGFHTVTLESDLSRDRLIEVLRGFSKQAEQADWAMIYYAGHGMELNGTNYLLPVDATIDSDRDIQFAGVTLDHAIASVESARRLRLVVLDACRDNPFARSMKRTTTTRSVGRGLARVEPEGATLVAYAAKHGEVALDGEGGNSPFVAALAKHLPTPGLEINKLFRLVRDEVLTATQRKQEPFVYGSLPADDFFFVSAR
jgi:tetratricopeptide (TPR) repeat protein